VPLDSKRKGDIKVIAGATVAVLFVGFFIFGAMFVTTRGGSGPQCGQSTAGLASDIRNTLNNGPYFQTGGGSCGYWLALENGDIVAYKAVQPSGCTAHYKRDHWDCGDSAVAPDHLAKYPTYIKTVNGVDALIVNLGTPAPSNATSTT